jgi:hypothetical protein
MQLKEIALRQRPLPPLAPRDTNTAFTTLPTDVERLRHVGSLLAAVLNRATARVEEAQAIEDIERAIAASAAEASAAAASDLQRVLDNFAVSPDSTESLSPRPATESVSLRPDRSVRMGSKERPPLDLFAPPAVFPPPGGIETQFYLVVPWLEAATSRLEILMCQAVDARSDDVARPLPAPVVLDTSSPTGAEPTNEAPPSLDAEAPTEDAQGSDTEQPTAASGSLDASPEGDAKADEKKDKTGQRKDTKLSAVGKASKKARVPLERKGTSDVVGKLSERKGMSESPVARPSMKK